MQQIINFFIRNKNFLLFLLLFLFSLSLTIQSHSYHRSKFINSANFLTGGVYESVNSIGRYFDLRKENELLLEENNRLKSILYNQEDMLSSTLLPSVDFKLITANVIKNSYSATNNYLTINKGTNDSISADLGVITSKGIVGIIDKASGNYSRVLSILNTNSRVNAQLMKTDHFGTLTWNGDSPRYVQLIDIPKQAPLTSGDTVITGGRSIIFPKGIPIGTISSFSLDETENYYNVEIEVFNDMTNIGHVHIVINKNKEEIKQLESSDE
ncbi:MAG: rod shape-determining protein MreC [Flavobacteriaceae bacterium]|nr:rod shape-determining protein MreC [Bacteroidia bacterium]NNK88771.1 rod shape-determining protein MreC [Flavobacteriaceae bacterium]